MDQPPRLTDRPALERNRARAARNPALFLHDWVADEIEERLKEVNRSFTETAVVTTQQGVWADRIPAARLITDDETLDVQTAAHDLVIHCLCLHWANDPVGQIAQSRLALRPDGLFLGALFGGQTLNELRICLAEAEASISGGLSPRVAPMGEIRDLGALLQRAGLALPVADSQPLTVSYENAFALMKDLRAMGESNAMEQRLRRPTARSVLVRAAELYSTNFAQPDGRIRATFEIVFLTGWAPSENQPKPLRPGSAKARLADALGTSETPVAGSRD
ncbi:SAM-dependent methyltransferase [Ponticoccus sp. SC2-23]|uniref:SAM-dependent methyltransferase n=1 Tax=Alexandriicola marinus TaxID=2081710 RepID=UPI000FD8AD27|nr:SAM-dependent methyltransferase [Alexandriicola marinus]MBM1220694.1 SAM-dependent methyltransferase [Ponticoccus sp. SC6-9]MBM1225953.1 SAM-dependent methyltransferase [Ponticoccus sp. SC6-15]MBM1231250.1 SAM-dependent methyltransferase [Ponticoccus sp. SC6-38]MBM1235889.1 SAM-dependent methyltransferase [Ponticoccus sp. SC6-45]MBM1240273.1 SAM-dependent methyltransferase [Ponticoccus sp. SC6-49]MBM1244808.1 SAM-dependent methyltransferase [Ponticoccus sp. SC2-64]MBM1249363.1 SAM-depende